MTTPKNDGGPAFPIETTATPYAPGMALRDWFAVQALNGLLAAQGGSWAWQDVINAYAIADAMMGIRSK